MDYRLKINNGKMVHETHVLNADSLPRVGDNYDIISIEKIDGSYKVAKVTHRASDQNSHLTMYQPLVTLERII